LIFVNSMSDLFHEDVLDEFVYAAVETMRRAHWHTFQLLTKRPERMASLATVGADGRPPLRFADNVWVGVSVENQRWTSRIDHLRRVPAKVRFLSCEPLLGPIEQMDLTGIHWVIVGGESGHRARPMKADWARGIRQQCSEAGVVFFFKQWGAYDEAGIRRGKAKTGRLLDKRTWDDLPTRGLRLSSSDA
jgi:protein gp37